jgi:hypothetical protein
MLLFLSCEITMIVRLVEDLWLYSKLLVSPELSSCISLLVLSTLFVYLPVMIKSLSFVLFEISIEFRSESFWFLSYWASFWLIINYLFVVRLTSFSFWWWALFSRPIYLTREAKSRIGKSDSKFSILAGNRGSSREWLAIRWVSPFAKTIRSFSITSGLATLEELE